MALYQEIMNVPGLTGSSYQRQKQLYERLGSPQGPYRGTYSQNIWLLNKVRAGEFGEAPAPPPPSPAPTPPAPAPAPALPEQFAEMAGARDVYTGPLFSEVLPFYKAWETLLPTVEQEAAAQIDPFIQRELRQQQQEYGTQLARTGGGRFGRALGGFGAIEAEAERRRRAQLLDWIGQRRRGFEELFYRPAEEAFMRSIELGRTPEAPTMPTWEEYARTIGSQFRPPKPVESILGMPSAPVRF